MANKKNKSSNFLKAVKKQSEEQRKVLLDNIFSAKSNAISKAEIEYKNEAERYINRQLSIIQTNIKSEYAVKDLKSQGELFKLRDEMVSKVFEKAKEKLVKFTYSPEYKALLLKFAKEISEAFNDNDCIIYLRNDDMKYKDDIIGIFKGNVTVEQDNKISIGGVKGYCRSLKIVADNTLDSKLSEQKSRFTEKAVLKIF